MHETIVIVIEDELQDIFTRNNFLYIYDFYILYIIFTIKMYLLL